MPFDRILENEFNRIHIALDPVQAAQLAEYCAAVDHWNRKINLTNLEGVDLVRRLVAEPTWIGSQLGLAGALLDVGSGNGSPAIPLSIMSSFTAVHLVEARLKRAAFLRHVASHLEMPAITVHHSRLEDLAIEIGPADWITLQAVAPTDALRQSLRRFSKPTTKVVWITARMTAPAPAATVIRVPDSETEAWIFGLDQS